MSNIFIVFKEPAIVRDGIKLLHSFKIRQLQGTVSTRTLVTQDHNNGKLFSDIKLLYSRNVAFWGSEIFKHCENSHLQTFHNPVKPTDICVAATHKYKLTCEL